MITHNLILKTDRCELPAENQLYNFVEERLVNPTVEYFGYEIDNPADYVDDEMQDEIDGSCYITIYFNHPEDLNEETAISFIKYAMKEDRIDRIETDGKDIDVVIL